MNVKTYTNTSITGRSIRAPRSVRHDGLHGAVGMLDSLRTVRMGDKLGRGGSTVRVFDGLSGRAARFGGLRRYFPLRCTGCKLDVVVLLAGTIPLRDPAWRE